jgi:hypothetical protein
MNVEELQQHLLICLSSGEPAIQNAANMANQYTEAFKAGQISKEEYTEILADVQRSINIQTSMSELEAKERLNVAINGLLNLASLV